MLKHNVSKEEKLKLINQLQEFFAVERDEDLGVIAAEELLDFFTEEIAEDYYKKGLADSKKWFMQKFHELDLDFDSFHN